MLNYREKPMKTLTQRFVSLAVFGLLTPVCALAHPGHEHAPGVLNAVYHAAIGWDQLLILFVVAAVVVHYLLRERK
jgi:hydrogenase/urease accessory protein HupE